MQNVEEVHIPEHGQYLSFDKGFCVSMKQECSFVIHKHNLLILSRLIYFLQRRVKTNF